MRLHFLYPGIGGGGAQRANGAILGTLVDDLCFPCRGANGCIDSWDARPVVSTGEVTASSNTAIQLCRHFAELCFKGEIDGTIREESVLNGKVTWDQT
jgi:hypothetical protein